MQGSIPQTHQSTRLTQALEAELNDRNSSILYDSEMDAAQKTLQNASKEVRTAMWQNIQSAVKDRNCDLFWMRNTVKDLKKVYAFEPGVAQMIDRIFIPACLTVQGVRNDPSHKDQQLHHNGKPTNMWIKLQWGRVNLVRIVEIEKGGKKESVEENLLIIVIAEHYYAFMNPTPMTQQQYAPQQGQYYYQPQGQHNYQQNPTQYATQQRRPVQPSAFPPPGSY